MKYAMVSVERALAAGFKKIGHNISSDGTQMMLNEKELMRLGSPASAAIQLGGRLVKHKTAVQRKRQINTKNFLNEQNT